MFQSSKVPDDDVLCPFCVSGKTRQFKKVGDLRHHVKNKHPIEMEHAPKGLFSTKTCFYFSINPLEYSKLHDVDKEMSPEVQYARYLMAKWSTGRSPGIEERTGTWEEALNKSLPRQLLNKPPPRQLLNKSPPRQLLNKPPPHHLKRKATDSLFLLAIVITLDSIKVFAESVSDVFQIRLYRNISTDRRAMETLKRREFLVKDAIESVGRWSTFPDSSLVLEEVASLLGIRSSYIHSIRKKDNIIFKAFCMADDDDARSLRSPSPISIHPEEITDTTSSPPTINKSLTTRLSTPVQEPARAATPATPLFDELPAPDPLSPLPSGTSTLQVIPPATSNYAPPFPLQDDHQTPVPASPLQSNTLQDLPPATPNYAPPSPL